MNHTKTKQKKYCQVPSGDEYYYICDEVYTRTGFPHLVEPGICEKFCNEKFIKMMCEKVTEWNTIHNQLEYPSAKKIVSNFFAAASAQFKAGNPQRELKEQERILKICTGENDKDRCRYYDKDARFSPRCKSCGCYIKRKIAWETTHCPLKKW